MKLTVKLAALAVVFVASCTKPEEEEENPNTPLITKTRTELLTQGKWAAFSEKAIIVENNVVVDSTESRADEDLEECEKDDHTIFSPAGNIIMLRGSIPCEANEQAQEVGERWKLVAGDTKLIIGQDSTAETFDILELSAAIFRIGMTDEENGSADFTRVEFTFRNVP